MLTTKAIGTDCRQDKKKGYEKQSWEIIVCHKTQLMHAPMANIAQSVHSLDVEY